VIDKKSGDDITRNILLQIIVEQEESSEPILSTDMLQQMIGFYGNSASRIAGDFLRNSVDMLYQQQKTLQSQVTNALEMAPMPPAFAEAAKRNMEMWQHFRRVFSNRVGCSTQRVMSSPGNNRAGITDMGEPGAKCTRAGVSGVAVTSAPGVSHAAFCRAIS